MLRILRSREHELLWQRPTDVQFRGFVGLASRLWQQGLLRQCLRRSLCSRRHRMRGVDHDASNLQQPGRLGERRGHQRTVQRRLHPDHGEDLQRQHATDVQCIRNMAIIGHELSILLQQHDVGVRRAMQFRRPEVRDRKYHPDVYEQPHMGYRAGLWDKSDLHW